jgi:hypothetical protein
MVLVIITYGIALLGAAAGLMPIRAWVHSTRGRESLSAWPVAAVIPLQTAIALLWLQALFSLPWIAWNLAQVVADPWWSVIRAAQVVFLLAFVPLTVAMVGDSWLRFHPLPKAWSLARIWLGGLVATAIATSIGALPADGSGEAAGLAFMFSVLTTLFLTRWWLITHPIKRNAD